MQGYSSIVDALDDLKKRGYEADFEPQTNCLYCNSMDLRLYEEEFHIDEIYHFVGESNDGQKSVVYALSSPTGVKGTIVDEHGRSSYNLILEKKIRGLPGVEPGN
jgi:hypothetical protein